MAQQQTIPVVITGADQQTPQGLHAPGKLLAAENVRISKGGASGFRLDKADGFAALPSATDSGSILTARKLGILGDELVAATTTSLYSFADGPDKWFYRGAYDGVTVDTFPIVANAYQQSAVDAATNTGLRLYAYQDSSGGVRYTIRDVVTGTQVVSNALVSINGRRPRVIAISGGWLVFYIDSSNLNAAGTLKVRKVTVASPNTLGSAVTIGADVNAATANQGDAFDVTTNGSYVALAYPVTLTYSSKVINWDPVGMTAVTTQTHDLTYGHEGQFLLHDPTTDNKLYWGIARNIGEGSVEVRYVVFNATTLALLNNVSVEPGAYATQITGWVSGTSVTLVYDAGLGKINVATSVALAENPTPTPLSWNLLASKVFTYGGRYYVLTCYEGGVSQLVKQDCYFLYEVTTKQVVAKSLPYSAGGAPSNTMALPRVEVDVTAQTASIPVRRVTDFQTDATLGRGKWFTPTGINDTRFNFADATLGNPVPFGRNLIFPGGYIARYDGATATQVPELGFHQWPQNALAYAEPGTALDANSTYSYFYTWCEIDAAGNAHRSAPSQAFEIVTDGTNRQTHLEVFNLKTVTPGRTVVLEIWRTLGNGSTYYKVSSTQNPVVNNPAINKTTLTDSVTDANASVGELWNAAVLPTYAPPAGRYLATWGNRMWLGGCEDRRLYFSKDKIAERGICFAPGFYLELAEEDGPITGLCAHGDRLLVFRPNSVWEVIGDGPDDTGANGRFYVKRLDGIAVGTTNANSIVATDKGVMFWSAHGPYIIDGGVTATYVGQGVQDHIGLTITAATVIPDAHQVRFTTSEGITLVWDTLFATWLTRTNQPSSHAIFWPKANRFVFFRPNGQINQETPGAYTDNGAAIVSRVRFAPVAFTAVAGWQRVWGIVLTGVFHADHRLKVTLTYALDYTTTTQHWTRDVTAALLAGKPYRFEVKPEKQQCTSIGVEVSDDYSTASPGQGFSLTALTFNAGVDGRTKNLGGSQRLVKQ